MSSIGHHGSGDIGASCITRNRFGLTAAVRSVVQVLAVAAAAAMLAACTQTTMVDQKPAFAVRTGVAQPSRMVSSVVRRPVAVARRHTPFTPRKHASATQAYGVASFYAHGARTANGEKFDPGKLTAAHRTLPFGTRLRVVNLTNNEVVEVRVNDRGPVVPGRILDLSYAAARKLRAVGAGVFPVSITVLREP